MVWIGAKPGQCARPKCNGPGGLENAPRKQCSHGFVRRRLSHLSTVLSTHILELLYFAVITEQRLLVVVRHKEVCGW